MNRPLSVLTAMCCALAPLSAQTPEMNLRGGRFEPLTYDQLTPEQKTMAGKVLSGEIQGGTGGPFNVLLRSPVLGESIVRYGEYVRFKTPIPPKLNELAVLITTRYWNAQFPFYVHHRAAAQAGLDEAIVKAIAEGRRPASMQKEEETIYNFCTELLKTAQVSDATFAAIKEQLGENGVVELLGIMGYYGMVSMLANTDGYPLPEGVAPELALMEQPLP